MLLREDPEVFPVSLDEAIHCPGELSNVGERTASNGFLGHSAAPAFHLASSGTLLQGRAERFAHVDHAVRQGARAGHANQLACLFLVKTDGYGVATSPYHISSTIHQWEAWKMPEWDNCRVWKPVYPRVSQ